ncbi:MAG: hypothetical protein BWY98_01005 [Tenericutes bacterium ADurb.BinA155]|nr:MAG: hypothetical protein BWY98_01005 [Tenericutes bacterium ADurb.BinA155]
MFGVTDVISEVTERAYKSKEFCLNGVDYKTTPTGDTLLLNFVLREDGLTKVEVRLDNVSPSKELLDKLAGAIGYDVTKFHIHEVTAECVLVLQRGVKGGANFDKQEFKLPGFLSLDKYRKRH